MLSSSLHLRSGRPPGGPPARSPAYRPLLEDRLASTRFAYSGDDCQAGPADTVTAPASPAAPSGLAANAVSPSRVDLTWADEDGDEDGFKLYSSDDGVNWTWFATTAVHVTAFSWWGASAGATHYFRVTAYNTIGESRPSNTATVKTPG